MTSEDVHAQQIECSIAMWSGLPLHNVIDSHARFFRPHLAPGGWPPPPIGGGPRLPPNSGGGLPPNGGGGLPPRPIII